MDDLFTVPEQLSPRLLWIKQHGIVLSYDDSPAGMEFGPWFASIPHTADADGFCPDSGGGPTEDDALADLARNMGIRLWNEQ